MEATPIMPAPGTYKLPLMDLKRLTATDTPGVIQMVFEVERRNADQLERLTIQVPLRALDAAGLLRSIHMLQSQGIVPIVPEADPNAPTN